MKKFVILVCIILGIFLGEVLNTEIVISYEINDTSASVVSDVTSWVYLTMELSNGESIKDTFILLKDKPKKVSVYDYFSPEYLEITEQNCYISSALVVPVSSYSLISFVFGIISFIVAGIFIDESSVCTWLERSIAIGFVIGLIMSIVAFSMWALENEADIFIDEEKGKITSDTSVTVLVYTEVEENKFIQKFYHIDEQEVVDISSDSLCFYSSYSNGDFHFWNTIAVYAVKIYLAAIAVSLCYELKKEKESKK